MIKKIPHAVWFLIGGAILYWLGKNDWFGIPDKLEVYFNQLYSQYPLWVAFGIILSVLLLLFVIWIMWRCHSRSKKLRTDLGKHNIVFKKAKSLVLTDFGLVVPNLKNQTYFQRKELDSKIYNFLEKQKTVLIVGRPDAGKTRTAFETMVKHYPKHKVLHLPPEFRKKEIPIDKFPLKSTILFLDDLNRTQYPTDVQNLIRQVLVEKGNRVIATVRSGYEQSELELKEPLLSEFRSSKVEIPNLSPEQVEDIKDFFELPEDRNGAAIGEILINFDDIRIRYNSLSDEAKNILRTVRLLYRSGVYLYSWKWIVNFLDKKKNIKIENEEVVVSEIKNREIASFRDGSIKAASDTYLEKLIDDFPLSNFKDERQGLIDYCIREKYDEFLFYIGNRFGEEQDYEKSIKTFDETLRIKKDSYVTWYNRGVALGQLGKHEVAIKSYDEALKFKNDYHEAWYNRGVNLGQLGRHEEAIKSYDKALRIKNDYHEAWNNRGTTLTGLGRHEEAIKSFDEALKIKKDSSEVWSNRGAALGYLGRHEEAIKSFDEALKIEKDNPKAWNNRGESLRRLGSKYEEAIKSFDEGLRIKENYPDAWFNRGLALRELGRKKEAMESFQKFLNFAPYNDTRIQPVKKIIEELRKMLGE